MLRWTNVKIGAGAGVLVLAVVGISIAVAQTGGAEKPAGRPAAAKPAPATPGSPKGVVVAAYKAGLAGDADTLVAAFAGLSKEQEVTLRRVVRVMAAVDGLQKAVAAKFGAPAARQFGAIGSGVDGKDVFDAPQKIDGNTAVVDMGPSGPGQVPLEKVGDQWKISAAVMQTLNADSVAKWEQRAPMIKQLAADIEAGKYATAADLQKVVGGMMR